jgi:hypothetical protein
LSPAVALLTLNLSFVADTSGIIGHSQQGNKIK